MAALSTQNSFRNAAAGVMAAMALTTMPFVPANDAQAQQPVEIAQSVKFASNPARGDNIVTRAGDYSAGRNVVGIAISAGADIPKHVSLQQVGERAQQELKKFGVDSEYFVEKNPRPDAGTSIAYFINGDSWSKNPMHYREGISKAKSVATDALFTFSYNILRDKNVASAPQAALQN